MTKLPDEPVTLFKQWFDEARAVEEVNEPDAVALATVDNQGRPSVRIMLLKGFDERGFCFYTNLTSRKGKELAANANAALCFHWDALKKQVRVEGSVERVSEREADRYFASRARGSQIGAWASKQSLAMDDDGDLPERVKAITEQFNGVDVPRPPFWSGFRLVPRRIEFWESADYRLHKRFLYTKVEGSWQIQRLFP